MSSISSAQPVRSAIGSPPEPSSKELRRAGWAGFIGTVLENYDMVVYGVGTAIIFNTLFFPNVSPAVGFIASFGAYAVGFIARPMGGLFFSRFGDKIGRKFVLVATLALMGTATFAMGLLPTYETAGILAPILLTVLRFIQGFGAGAEMASAVVLLAEFAPRGKRGAMTSLVWAGAAVGSVFGSLAWILVQLLPREDLESWGWRLVFLSSAVVTVAAYFIRRHMKESPVFAELKREQVQAASPIKEVLQKGRRPLRQVFLINMGTHAHSYIYQAFLGTFLISVVNIDKALIPQMLAIGGLFAIPAALIAGRATDRWGRKPVNVFILSFLFLFSFPAFWLSSTGNVWLIALVYAVGFTFAVEGGISAQSAMYAELFGSKYRYAGVAIAREFSAIFGGGIAPIICSALLVWATNSYWPIALYMMVIVGISLVQALKTPETKDRDLTLEENAA
ncbi:MFS transporter [Pseudarthrobacter sp. O4]|uniref:MFS transporter n=1 Tax=Pseudarthrobacter sp. O4 TaxID=3418417 RepID=UPI003CE93F54